MEARNTAHPELMPPSPLDVVDEPPEVGIETSDEEPCQTFSTDLHNPFGFARPEYQSIFFHVEFASDL